MQVDLDGRALLAPADVYRVLAEPLSLPLWFGANPDALWDVLSERPRPEITIAWHHADVSAARFGPAFQRLADILQTAAAKGLIRFRME